MIIDSINLISKLKDVCIQGLFVVAPAAVRCGPVQMLEQTASILWAAEKGGGADSMYLNYEDGQIAHNESAS